MKVKSKRSQLQATCLFTDREEPRNAFWKKYSQLKEEMAYMYGEEFTGLLVDKIEEANRKRSTSMRSRLWGTRKN